MIVELLDPVGQRIPEVLELTMDQHPIPRGLNQVIRQGGELETRGGQAIMGVVTIIPGDQRPLVDVLAKLERSHGRVDIAQGGQTVAALVSARLAHAAGKDHHRLRRVHPNRPG